METVTSRNAIELDYATRTFMRGNFEGRALDDAILMATNEMIWRTAAAVR